MSIDIIMAFISAFQININADAVLLVAITVAGSMICVCFGWKKSSKWQEKKNRFFG